MYRIKLYICIFNLFTTITTIHLCSWQQIPATTFRSFLQQSSQWCIVLQQSLWWCLVPMVVLILQWCLVPMVVLNLQWCLVPMVVLNLQWCLVPMVQSLYYSGVLYQWYSPYTIVVSCTNGSPYSGVLFYSSPYGGVLYQWQSLIYSGVLYQWQSLIYSGVLYQLFRHKTYFFQMQ